MSLASHALFSSDFETLFTKTACRTHWTIGSTASPVMFAKTCSRMMKNNLDNLAE